MEMFTQVRIAKEATACRITFNKAKNNGTSKQIGVTFCLLLYKSLFLQRGSKHQLTDLTSKRSDSLIQSYVKALARVTV